MEPVCPRCGEPSEGLCPRCTGYLLRFEPYVLRPGLPGPSVDRETRHGVAFLSLDPKGAVRFVDSAAPRGGESFDRLFLRHVGLPDRGAAALTRGDRQTIHRMFRAWVRTPPRSEDAKSIQGALYAEAASLPDMPPHVAQLFRTSIGVPGPSPRDVSPPLPPPPEPVSEGEPEEPLPAPPVDARPAEPMESPSEALPLPESDKVLSPKALPQMSSGRPEPPTPDGSNESTEEAVALDVSPGDSAEEKQRLASWMEEQHAEVERRRDMVRSQLDELQQRESEIAEREQRVRDEEHRQQERGAELKRKAEEAAPGRALYLVLFSLEGVSREAASAIADAFLSEEKLRAAPVEQIAAVPGVKPEVAALVRDAFSEGAPQRRNLREKAEDLLEEERFEEGLEVFDAIVREDPGDVDAWFNRAEVLALLRRTEEAIASLDHVLEIDPGHKGTLRELANLLFERGDFGLAAAHLNELLKQAPDEADHWLRRAAELLTEGKATEATLIYNAILEGDATNLPASLALGDLLLAMDDVERADRVYSRVLQHHPDSPEALLKKGLLLNRQGRWGAAIQMFNRAITLRFDYREAWAVKGQVLLTQGKAKEALEAFDKLLSFDQTQYGAWLGKAQAHLVAGEIDKAAEAAGRALVLNKGNADAQGILRRLGADLGAPVVLPEGIGGTPRKTVDPGVLIKISDSILEAGDGESALSGYEEVLRASPTDGRALFGKGRALHALDRYKEALRCFTEAVRVAPKVEEYERWRRTCEERVRKEESA